MQNFGKPNFKYHLINQAAFESTKRIENTPTGTNIINFVKACLPLFLGAQFKIEGDNINIDFLNINGVLIPVSTIMENIYNEGTLASQRIGLYSNYQVPWLNMLKEKTSFPVENEQYYTAATTEVGSSYGKNLYEKINIGTIHLRVALASLK